jgi:hypothetical protein
MSSLGTDFMKEINEGRVAVRSSAFAEEVKIKTTDAMSELITFGARVRPLSLKGEQIGWVKALPFNEKKQLDIWYPDENTRIEQLLLHTTTLTSEEVNDLDSVELNTILRVILSLNLADLSLYPYVSAFVSTNTSFRLSASHSSDLLAPKRIVLPDGKELKQLSSPDILQLWVSLCRIRETTIERLENAQNAGTIAKAFVGKGADNYNNAISQALASLRTDSIEPWMDVINFLSVKTDQNLHDGYGHSHQDNSTEGLMREMRGMNEGDKHEQLMDAFHQSQLREEEEKRRRVDELIARRREILEAADANEIMVVRTEAEVKKREREIHTQKYGWIQEKQKRDLLNQADEEAPVETRLSKYV